jgi:HAD superfamily hydrolase (TIGR01509 family)
MYRKDELLIKCHFYTKDFILSNLIKAILFDIGGTLVYKQNHGSHDLGTISEMGRIIGSESSPESLLTKLLEGENAYKDWHSRAFVELTTEQKWTGFFLPDLPEKFISTKASTLQALWKQSRDTRTISPGTITVLKELKSRGYLLVTVSHTSPDTLKSAGIDDMFVANLHAAKFGIRKPHPSIFLEAARICNVTPGECAFVGDRPSRDVIGSREAGIGEVIIIENEFSTHEKEYCPMQPDLIISDLSELLDHFKPLDLKLGSPVLSHTTHQFFDVALSSMNWDQAKEGINDFLQAGRDLGFVRFDLNHQIPDKVFTQIDLNRFHIGSLHNPCPAILPMKQLEAEDKLLTSLDEKRRISGVDILKVTIENAQKLAARSVVIHAGLIPGYELLDRTLRSLYKNGKRNTPEYAELKTRMIAERNEKGKPHLDSLLKSFREIIDFTKNSNLMLGVENLFFYEEFPILNEMQLIMDEFPQPWFGWQFDVGHLKVQENLGLASMDQWQNSFKGRLIGVHLHDVKGLIDHLAPGTGDMDFSTAAPYLPIQILRTLEVAPSVSRSGLKNSLSHLEESKCLMRL